MKWGPFNNPPTELVKYITGFEIEKYQLPFGIRLIYTNLSFK